MRGEPEWNASVARSLTLCVEQHASLTRASLRVHQVPLISHTSAVGFTSPGDQMAKTTRARSSVPSGPKRVRNNKRVSVGYRDEQPWTDHQITEGSEPGLLLQAIQFHADQQCGNDPVDNIVKTWVVSRARVVALSGATGANPRWRPKKNCAPQREFQMAARTLWRTKP